MKNKVSNKWSFNYTMFVISVSIAAVIAFGIHKFTGLNFWICLGLVVFGILINGLVATIEDELPGGYHNPISKTKK